MTYKASDIVKKAEQLSDLTNTDFITWNEKISLLNDAYTMLYQKLVDIGDSSFVKPFIAQPGENILPPDFWQLKSVNLVQNKVVTPIKRRADSEGYNTQSYEIRFDRLYLNGTFYNGDIVVDYWAKPKTLTYKPEPVTLNPVVNNNQIIGVHDEKFFWTGSSTTAAGNSIYYYDCKTEQESQVMFGTSNLMGLHLFNELGVFFTSFDVNNNTFHFFYYDDNAMSNPSGIPFITESSAIGTIIDGKGKISNHVVFDWDYDSDAQLVVCNDDLTDFFYTKKNETRLYHNGVPLEINGEPLYTGPNLMYVNGNCWYCKSNEVGYVDQDDNLHILSTRYNINGINKIDGNTGYGYTVGTTVYPWVEDTVLDFPNSMYFTIMSYMLAIQFKIKQGADETKLMTVLSTLENTFYDTLTQDANNFIRIKNVY